MSGQGDSAGRPDASLSRETAYTWFSVRFGPPPGRAYATAKASAGSDRDPVADAAYAASVRKKLGALSLLVDELAALFDSAHDDAPLPQGRRAGTVVRFRVIRSREEAKAFKEEAAWRDRLMRGHRPDGPVFVNWGPALGGHVHAVRTAVEALRTEWSSSTWGAVPEVPPRGRGERTTAQERSREVKVTMRWVVEVTGQCAVADLALAAIALGFDMPCRTPGDFTVRRRQWAKAKSRAPTGD